MDHDAMVARIVATYDEATAEQVAAGAAWYSEAQAAAAALAAGTHLTERHAAGIIAALSPMTQWATSLRNAAAVVDAAVAGAEIPRCGLTSNVERAWRIAHGEEPADVLAGPKVRAFFANIIGDPMAVTVDRWAVRVALGQDVPSGLKGKAYELIAEAYRAAARLIGTDPATVQAATWIVERGSAA